MSPTRRFHPITLLALALLASVAGAVGGEDLREGFRTPPASARPWVYWFWLNGNITAEGITADLEAMARVGVGGVLIMEVDQGAPVGPVDFASDQWRALFQHMVREADRLGLEVNMNNDAGWCGSGGPWMPPELAMQRLVWSETPAHGPGSVSLSLPQPPTTGNYYRDVAVLAFPTPERPLPVPSLAAKSVGQSLGASLPAPAAWPEAPEGSIVPLEGIVDLSDSLAADGKLEWQAPAGEWTILRLGHTLTGAVNAPSPATGRGLECDKLSREAAEAMYAGLIGRLADEAGDLAGRSLVTTHIDSWEVGVQNWTPRFREEFQARRGYDPLPWLAVAAGQTVGSRAESERFLWDWRQTVSDLLLDNYAGAFRELANRDGLRLSIEAYSTCPTDEMAYAGRSDEPMGEFWSSGRYGAAFSVREMSSAAHVYGKTVVGAEAFTAGDGERWLLHPGNVKELGDWAFCEGINRFVFHRYALQPWLGVRPGMGMGPWGLHYERTQTWWAQSDTWHEYLSRCQYLLRQGLFVADTCLLGPEGSPQSAGGQTALASLERPEHNFDLCPPDALLTRMSVRDGRLVLPDGMSYRLLALPRTRAMTPELARKLRELVLAGASVVGPKPITSPSLGGYPDCDAEVRAIADELWGEGPPAATVTERRVGKGRVICGGAFEPAPEAAEADQPSVAGAKWIWTPEGNPAASAPPSTRWFARTFEVADPSALRSARLAAAADNQYRIWLNGQSVGTGESWSELRVFDVRGLLRAGGNLLAISATNTTDKPSPAGLIASLSLQPSEGAETRIVTDSSWGASEQPGGSWPAPSETWPAAMELGPVGIGPWGHVEATPPSSDLYPDLELIEGLYRKWSVPADFASQSEAGPAGFRYIHRRADGTDIYFVSNKEYETREALCSFRTEGKRPELWHPESGRTELPLVYDTASDGTVRVPLRLGPAESVFVLFAPETEADRDRVTRIEREGALVASTEWRPAPPPAASGRDVTGSFSFAVWARPTAETALPDESAQGAAGIAVARNDALYPAPGHEVWGLPTDAGAGLAIGTNGVVVYEHSADYFAPILVWSGKLEGWTHVGVVYREGTPTLYLDGKAVRTGLPSTHVVHLGVGVRHGRGVPAFRGDLGAFTAEPRALSGRELASWPDGTPRLPERGPEGAIELTRGVAGDQAIVSAPGGYTLRRSGGRSTTIEVPSLPAPIEVAGPWTFDFTPEGGEATSRTLEELTSWHASDDPGLRYHSGSGTYATEFDLPAELLAPGRALRLSLGEVAVVAEVKLNGRRLGTLWRAPWEVDITRAARAGANRLEVTVTNLLINRQIGDELLAEDSERNPDGTLRAWPQWLLGGQPSPTGRHTFAHWRLWSKDGPLQESGLLGPVAIRSLAVVDIARAEARSTR